MARNVQPGSLASSRPSVGAFIASTSKTTPALAPRCRDLRDHHAAYRQWQSALGPDGPHLRVARGADDRPTLLGDDQPLRRYGQAGQDRAALAAAIHLSGADILWAESADVLLKQAVESDPSPLEQVFSVSPTGTVGVTASVPDENQHSKGRAPGEHPGREHGGRTTCGLSPLRRPQKRAPGALQGLWLRSPPPGSGSGMAVQHAPPRRVGARSGRAATFVRATCPHRPRLSAAWPSERWAPSTPPSSKIAH